MDADRGEEQELLAIIDKSDDSLYNLSDSFVQQSHCSTVPLLVIPIVVLIAAVLKILQMT